MAYNFNPKICIVCGKQFIPAPCSIYTIKHKRRTYHVCSYNCRIEAMRLKSKNELTKTIQKWYNYTGGDNHEQQ